MSSKITKNDIPGVDAIKAALLEVLASGRSRSFANVGGDVAKTLGLSREHRAYGIGTSKNSLFENRLVQARAELTKEGAISYRAGKVRLEKRGAVAAKQANQNAVAALAPDKSKSSDERSTKCLCIKEPFASYVVSGVKDVEFRTWKVNVPIHDLVICASKTVDKKYGKIPGLAYGLAIGMVDVVECVESGEGYAWKLERPRLVKPFPVRGSVGFFKVADIPEVVPNDAESYREHVLPYCHRGSQQEEDDMIASLYASSTDRLHMKYDVYWQKFNRMRGGAR